MSGTGSVGNNPAVNRAFSNFVQNNAAAANLAVKDQNGRSIQANAISLVSRMYVNSKGELHQSSNAISHAFRKLFGKETTGEFALKAALTKQVGEKTAQHLLENLIEAGGNLRTLKDIDDVIHDKKFATWDPTKENFYVDINGKERFEELKTKDLNINSKKHNDLTDMWRSYGYGGIEHKFEGKARDNAYKDVQEARDMASAAAEQKRRDHKFATLTDMTMRTIANSSRMNEFSHAAGIKQTGRDGYSNWQADVIAKNPILNSILKDLEEITENMDSKEFREFVSSRPDGGCDLVDWAIRCAKVHNKVND